MRLYLTNKLRKRERERENINDVLNTQNLHKIIIYKIEEILHFNSASIAIMLLPSPICMLSHFQEWPFIWEKNKRHKIQLIYHSKET